MRRLRTYQKEKEGILMLKKTIGAGVAFLMIQTSAFAADFYTVNPPSAGIFGTPTSVTTVVVGDNVNKAAVDLSKNSALIPPAFGSHTSNVRNTGEPLTPNLASPYVDAATGTAIVGSITSTTTQPSVTVSTNTKPDSSMSDGSGVNAPGTMYEDEHYYEEPAFTKVTSSMYYTGGHLGTLKIPELDLSVKIYEDTTNAVLAKGVGHFKGSSIWNGNVCLAAHNRGTNNYFGGIHELEYGDTIKLTTKKGTRTYEVYSIKKISVYDTSKLQSTADNIITLITCVKNQAEDYRWCVQGYEVK